MENFSRSCAVLGGVIEATPDWQRRLEVFARHWPGRWERFLAAARQEINPVAWYGRWAAPVLHVEFLLACGCRGEWVNAAQRRAADFLDSYGRLLETGNEDHDPWIHAAAMARRAVGFSWAYQAGVLSSDVWSQLGELFVADSLSFAETALERRVPPHSNNQGMALALNLMAVGHLWRDHAGHRQACAFLLERGWHHFAEQLCLHPSDGYGGEGSTYAVLVAEPLTALASALFEESSGASAAALAMDPDGSRLEKILRCSSRLRGASGLAPAWDQYSYIGRWSGTTLGYAARRFATPEDLARATQLWHGDGWERSGKIAWLADDHIWQLIFMPEILLGEDPPAASSTPGSLLLPETAALLRSATGSSTLLQMWDASSERPVRAHLNPNNLLLEAFGSPLVIDGEALPGCPLLARPEMQYEHQYSETPQRLSWAPGSLAAHSVIIVDGNDAIAAPDHHLRGTPLVPAPGELLAVDTAGFYQGLLRSCIRSIQAPHPDLWLVQDEIEADAPRAIRWQLITRPGAELIHPGHVRLRTAEHVVLDVISIDGSTFIVEDFPGLPLGLEGCSVRLCREQRGTGVRFLTALAASEGRRAVLDLTDRMEWWSSEGTPTPGDDPRWQPLRWELLPRAGTIHARVLFDWPDYPGEAGDGSYALQLPQAEGLIARWNGAQLAFPALTPCRDAEPRLLPPFAPLPETPTPGTPVLLELELENGLFSPPFGNIILHRLIEPPLPSVRYSQEKTEVSLPGALHGGWSLVITRNEVESSPARPPLALPSADSPPYQAPLPKLLEPAQEETDQMSSRELCLAFLRRPQPDNERLFSITQEAQEWLTRSLAIRALGAITATSAMERAAAAIRSILQNELARPEDSRPGACRWRLKEACLLALHQLGDQRDIDLALKALDGSQFYGVRRLAAALLLRLARDGAPIPHQLATAASDPDLEVARLARQTLRLASLIA